MQNKSKMSEKRGINIEFWPLLNLAASAGCGEQLLQPRRGRADSPPVPRGQGGQPTKVQASSYLMYIYIRTMYGWWHSSIFLHRLAPWVVLLSAGFESATLGVRVRWLNQWATEEPVFSHSLGRSSSVESCYRTPLLVVEMGFHNYQTFCCLPTICILWCWWKSVPAR